MKITPPGSYLGQNDVTPPNVGSGGGSGVTSVTGTSPVASSGGTTPDISLPTLFPTWFGSSPPSDPVQYPYWQRDTDGAVFYYYTDVDSSQWVQIPAGAGIPQGGTTGQVLTKIDGTDFNVDWEDVVGGVASVSNSDGTLTVSPTTGAVVASLNLGHANTWTATVKFRAGATGAGSAPIIFQSGSLLTTPVVGAVEFLTDKWYGTVTTSTARKEFTLNDAALTAGSVPYVTTNGRLTDAGTALSYYATDSRLGIGVNLATLSGAGGDRGLLVSRAVATYAAIQTSLTTGYAGVLIRNNSGDAGTFVTTSSSFGSSGMYQASNCYLTGQVGDLYIASTISGKVMRFIVNGTATTDEAAQIDNNKNVVVGTAALATNATNGFFYIPTCAGAPTGTPTAKTGRVPMIFDSTNNNFYIYNGGWKKVLLS